MRVWKLPARCPLVKWTSTCKNEAFYCREFSFETTKNTLICAKKCISTRFMMPKSCYYYMTQKDYNSVQWIILRHFQPYPEIFVVRRYTLNKCINSIFKKIKKPWLIIQSTLVNVSTGKVDTPPNSNTSLDKKLREKVNSNRIWSPDNSNHRQNFGVFSVQIKRCWHHTDIETLRKFSAVVYFLNNIWKVKPITVWTICNLWSNLWGNFGSWP